MKSFILLTFAFLAWSWYEMSGGAGFNRPQELAAADRIESERLAQVARADTSATPLTTVSRPARTSDVVLASASAAPAVRARPAVAQQLDLTLAKPARMPLARPSEEMLAKVASLDTLTDASPAPASDLREVTGNVVNMRNGPGTGHHVVDQLRRNARVEVLADNGDGWVKLRTVADDRVGWMSDRFLSAVN